MQVAGGVQASDECLTKVLTKSLQSPNPDKQAHALAQYASYSSGTIIKLYQRDSETRLARPNIDTHALVEIAPA
jgi:hypothetical protein